MASPLGIRARLAAALTPPTSRPAPPAPRADAVNPATVSGAAISNSLSKLGSSRDIGATARPNVERQYLDEDELAALFRGTVYRRICSLPAMWATTKGWQISDDSEEAHPLRGRMEELGVREAFRAADTFGAAMGEARILLVTDQFLRRPAEPLDPSKVRRVHALHVFDSREFSPVEWGTSSTSPYYGRPEWYQLHPSRPGVSSAQARVHASHLLRFYGDALPPSEVYRTASWRMQEADAVGQVLWDAIRGLAGTGNAGFRLAEELSVAVFGISDLASRATSDQRETFLDRMTLINLSKSVANAILLGPGETYQRVSASPTGFKDLSDSARLFLSLTCGIPMALLFGEAPAGLTSDSGSWWDNWVVQISDRQQSRYMAPLRTVARCLYAEAGGEPKSWSIAFAPLGEMSETEKASARLQVVQADSQAILDGLVSVERVRRSRYGADGWSWDLSPPTPEEEALEAGGGALSGEDLAAAVAERLKQEGGDPAQPPDPAAAPAPAVDPSGSQAPPDPEAILPESVTPLNGAQIQAAQGILASVAAGELAAEAGRLLLEGIVPPGRAADLIRATRGDALDEDFRTKRFKVPAGAKGNAQRVLDWREEHPDEIQGMTETGWRRARQLATEDTVSGQDLIEMAAWFARHGAQAATRRVDPKFEGEPWRDAGWVSWLGWGGDTAKAWATSTVERARADAAEDSIVVMAMLPEALRPIWEGNRAAVAEVAGQPVEAGDDPHVTILYAGKGPREAAVELASIAREIAGRFAPCEASADDLHLFGPGEHSDGATPAVLRVEGAWALWSIHERTLRRAAHLVTVPQFDEYRPHLTLGYLAQPVSDETRARLLALEMGEIEWTVTEIVVRRGAETIATIPLAGREDAAPRGTAGA